MKKYLAIVVAGLVLSACMNAQPNRAVAQQNVEWTPEQYAKLAEAINNNKAQIIEHLNQGINEKLQGKTFEIPVDNGSK